MVRKIIIALIITGIIALLVLLSLPVLVKSYYSTVASCRFISEENLESQGVVLVGQAVQTTSQDGEKEITVEFFQEPSDTVKKHEYCHVKQFKDDRGSSCLTVGSKFLDEVECYLAEKLPNGLFIELYGQYLILLKHFIQLTP